jgi:hypothetical protein
LDAIRELTFLFSQLTREYKAISENPPPYISAHPSESNILEYDPNRVEIIF